MQRMPPIQLVATRRLCVKPFQVQKTTASTGLFPCAAILASSSRPPQAVPMPDLAARGRCKPLLPTNLYLAYQGIQSDHHSWCTMGLII